MKLKLTYESLKQGLESYMMIREKAQKQRINWTSGLIIVFRSCSPDFEEGMQHSRQNHVHDRGTEEKYAGLANQVIQHLQIFWRRLPFGVAQKHRDEIAAGEASISGLRLCSKCFN